MIAPGTRTGPRVAARFRRQGGGVSAAAVGCIALIALLSLLTADIGLYIAARCRAKDAANSAALAAVQESFPLFATGVGPQAAASRFAAANGATADEVSVSDGGQRARVVVSVRPESLLLRRLGIGPDRVSACSAAEVDMDALLASGAIWYTTDPTTLNALKSLIASGKVKDAQGAATMVALLAMQHLGQPYVWGATGPNSFDCSGLVCYVYAQIGVGLPRVTFDQVRCGRAGAPSELAPGDLVFFRRNNHVGIYLGGGFFIHAPRTGDVVKMTPLSARSDVSACRRIL